MPNIAAISEQKSLAGPVDGNHLLLATGQGDCRALGGICQG